MWHHYIYSTQRNILLPPPFLMKTFLLSRLYPLPRMTGALIMKISSSLSILMVWEDFLFFFFSLSSLSLSLFLMSSFSEKSWTAKEQPADVWTDFPLSLPDLYVSNHVFSAVDLQVWWRTCSGLHCRTLHAEQTFNRWKDSEVSTHRSQIQTQPRLVKECKISGMLTAQPIIVAFSTQHILFSLLSSPLLSPLV